LAKLAAARRCVVGHRTAVGPEEMPVGMARGREGPKETH